MKITLTGSLGDIGSSLAKQLLKNGHKVLLLIVIQREKRH
ncbi:nucleoside-diphosphate-sugar epimerase [Pedobacter sp. UYP1]